MAFQLVNYSQQDPKWKSDRLGFGDSGDTIGYVGCALTATAMLLSGHGYPETPKTLNKKLQDVGGFVGAAIVWAAVSKIHPNVTLKAYIPCSTSDAPLAQIDASIAAGQPVIVQVDSSPASGIQTHWVVLYERKAGDYLMLDPWPYPSITGKEDYLMNRYAQGKSLKRAISHVILYEAYGSGPGGPVTVPSTPGTDSARVKLDVTWGLNIRSSIDTSSMANVIATVPAGTILLLLEADGPSKIGAVNQWVRVRTPDGREGFAAAWYLEKVPGASNEPSTGSTSPEGEAPASEASKPKKPKKKMIVVVSDAVGTSGLRMRKTASKGGALARVLPAGTELKVLEPAKKAASKIGKANEWIYVREPEGKRGYVEAQYLRLPTA
ncbi:MAG: SH3 domain-containing protein [Chloroflexi bacterium]|nr:SH3 domain-containing protein [Chloroflexota bacterium]